jgi:cyclopropane fatty-acyl-phospholipid synthase-like methyltransferase
MPEPLTPVLTLKEAQDYVGTIEISGQLQLELLKKEGCVPESKVLEIGCGCLHLGVPLIEYLDAGNYVGIDPNEWLAASALEDPIVQQLVTDKQARLIHTIRDFNVSELGIKFDYIFSHSVLSHCAHWQLEQFIRNTRKVLVRPTGKILASIRLAAGNMYGSTGTHDQNDSHHNTWQYPGISWFSFATVREQANIYGLDVVMLPEYTEFYTQTRPGEYHDWIVFEWQKLHEEN